jgi:ubiquinone/menaquinone biosynthesis C-methylase UbiE
MRDSAYWTRSYDRRRSMTLERSWIGGIDPEQVFLDEGHRRVNTGTRLLDIGCGPGRTVNELARSSSEAWGIDFSERLAGIAKRSDEPNAHFATADARELPFPDEAFDLVISERGPALEDRSFATETHRVLKAGGSLVSISIGERDKENIKRIFGRGQLYASLVSRASEAERQAAVLAELGFENVNVDEYDADEYFDSLDDLVARLEAVPIIPEFDATRDRAALKCAEHQLRYWVGGLRTNSHRLIATATKVRRNSRR